MRCIVVCQPYASAIIDGIKDIENRTWRPGTVGDLAIMAGKSHEWTNVMTPKQKDLLQPLLPWDELPYGFILGWVTVMDVVDMNYTLADNPWAFGPVCWKLGYPKKFTKPIPFRGRQGIFHVPDELLMGAEYIGQARS